MSVFNYTPHGSELVPYFLQRNLGGNKSWLHLCKYSMAVKFWWKSFWVSPSTTWLIEDFQQKETCFLTAISLRGKGRYRYPPNHEFNLIGKSNSNFWLYLPVFLLQVNVDLVSKCGCKTARGACYSSMHWTGETTHKILIKQFAVYVSSWCGLEQAPFISAWNFFTPIFLMGVNTLESP